MVVGMAYFPPPCSHIRLVIRVRHAMHATGCTRLFPVGESKEQRENNQLGSQLLNVKYQSIGKTQTARPRAVVRFALTVQLSV